MGLRPSVKADLALLGVSAIWGGTFVVVKRALVDASPFSFLAVRFVLSAALLAWFFRREIFPFDGRAAAAGGVLGFFLAAGFGCQTVGLLYTTPSRSAFITGLYVVGVPILAALLGLRGLSPASLAGVALAFAGLYLLTGAGAANPGAGFGRGEILTLFCALAFAAHIVGVDICTRRYDPRSLTFWQIAAAALLCLPVAGLAETPRMNPTPALAGAILATAVLGTVVALAVQNQVQARTTPTRVAIIFTMEPVFAALTSYLVERERMGLAATAGAAMILAGMLVCEIPGARSRRSAEAR